MRLTLSMASYGRPQRTIRAINSIANQNINGWEALVIGDGCPVMQDFIDSDYFEDLIETVFITNIKIIKLIKFCYETIFINSNNVFVF